MQPEWINAIIGGGLIGLSASLLLLANGKITGVSGILMGVFSDTGLNKLWRATFIVGLLLGGFLGALFLESPFINESDRPTLAVALAGLLVGFGTQLGSGCTSGHGVCGISRLSARSLVATATFIGSGVVTVTLYSLLGGGL